MASMNLVVLYESGMSIKQIARTIGTNYSATRRKLITEGAALRTRALGTQLAGINKRGVSLGNQHTPEQIAARVQASARARAASASGISVKPSGYVEYTTGPNKGRSVHVVQMEIIIGRRLERGEIVHHKNGQRADNRPENLELMTRSEHSRHHRLEDTWRRQRDQLGRFCGNEGA